MAISCDPNDLAEASKCFCFDKKSSIAVELYLLYVISGSTLTVNELLQAAADAGFYGISDKQSQEAVRLYLLCSAATAAGA